MKRIKSDVPKYKLNDFRKVHRQDSIISSFGHNQFDPAKTINGFEIYSSEGIIPSAGPLKSEFYRVSITVTGTLDMQIGLEHYPHQPSTLAFTFPNQIFSKNNASKDASGYYLLFNSDFLNDIIPSIQIGDEFPFYNTFGTPVFQISTDELDNVLSIVMKVNNELQCQKTGREKAIKMYLYFLLLEAKRSYERQNIGNADSNLSEHHKLVSRFRKLVAKYYLTKRQVRDYAQLLGVSANHLNKTVKQNTGQTASEAIREMLLQESKLMLLYSDKSISEIAYQLDFSDPTSFNRFFKSIANETPLSFRKGNK